MQRLQVFEVARLENLEAGRWASAFGEKEYDFLKDARKHPFLEEYQANLLESLQEEATDLRSVVHSQKLGR